MENEADYESFIVDNKNTNIILIKNIKENNTITINDIINIINDIESKELRKGPSEKQINRNIDFILILNFINNDSTSQVKMNDNIIKPEEINIQNNNYNINLVVIKNIIN